MFTGLIEEIGTVEGVAESDAGRELRIRSSYTDLVAGESIAVSGACLTVRELGHGWFTAAAVTTTLDRTAIGAWDEGTRVNLERALRVGDRLGGHIVQGHVDGVGTVSRTARHGDALLIDVDVPAPLEELMVPHGSVAVDGVSLTINEILPGGLQLSLIEYTLRHTTLGDCAPGSRVHIEVDVIARQIRRLLEPYLRDRFPPPVSADFSLHH